MTFARISSGKRGEELAVSCLRREGYKIIERNYRTILGEIDIIADYKGCACFIEVRAKNDTVFGLPEETEKDIDDTAVKMAQHLQSSTI